MELSHAIRLVADFLKDQGLLETYACLLKEAGIPTELTANELCSCVDAEDWPALLAAMARTPFRTPANMYKTVYQQIINRMIQLGEHHIANKIKEEKREYDLQVTAAQSCDPESLKKLLC